MSSKVSESKKSALYQKCGYTTLKEVFVRLENVTLDSMSESEFSKSVSGEKLLQPSERLYRLSQHLLANRLIEGFQVVRNAAYIKLDNSVFK